MTEIRKMQLAIVDMMRDLDILLRQNNIVYTLLGGSVLGAVRHKGFIPWDDDMDIGIMRKDFERAEKLLSEFSPYVYEHAEKHMIPGAPIGHLHLVNKIYAIENSPTIDVFALDKVPESKKARKRLRFIANIHHLCLLRRPPQNRGRLNRFIFTIFLKITHEKILDMIQRSSLKKITSNNEKEFLCIGNIFGFWAEKEYFPKDIYESRESLEFEGLSLPCPKDYDKYLTQLYGNYMQLPPVEQRVPKHRELWNEK